MKADAKLLEITCVLVVDDLEARTDGRELRPGSPNYNCVKEAVVRQPECERTE